MPVEAMRRLFAVKAEHDGLGNAEPLPAIFPKGSSPIVSIDEDGHRRLETAHWGFVLPQKSKKTSGPIQPKAINNARDDKLRTSRFWKSSFEKRRCLLPATNFCEAKGRNPATYVWFGLRGEEARPPFAFAGIWSRSATLPEAGPDANATVVGPLGAAETLGIEGPHQRRPRCGRRGHRRGHHQRRRSGCAWKPVTHSRTAQGSARRPSPARSATATGGPEQ